MNATLDILVPHYRDPAGLALSLRSIAAQTWGAQAGGAQAGPGQSGRRPMRTIVLDDGSPSEDYAAAEAAAAEVRGAGLDIVVLRNPVNLGRPRTRNLLLAAATADHVAWLDAGDIWYPDKLAVQFAHLARLRDRGEDVDRVWVTCGYDWHRAADGRVHPMTQTVEGDQFRALLTGSHLRAYLWTLLGTRAAFAMAGDFDDRLPRLQDLDYALRFVRGGGRLVAPAAPAPLCRYFKSGIGRHAEEVHAAFALILAKNRPAIRRYPPAFSTRLHFNANRLAARFAAANGDRLTSAGYLARALWHDPAHGVRQLAQGATRRWPGRRVGR